MSLEYSKSEMSRTCEEVKIPISWGKLAGKLWPSHYPHVHSTKQTGVLMLHGILDNAASFDPLIPYFPQEMTLLAIDLAGHGFSDHYSEKNSYHHFSLISDVIEVLRYLSWEQVVLVGHSLGGILAISVAGMLPNIICKLVIIDILYILSNSYQHFANFMVSKYEQDRKPQREKIYSTREEVVERIMQGHAAISQASAEILSTRSCKEENGGFVLTRDIDIPKPLLFYSRYVFWEAMGQLLYDKITMPALFTIAEDSHQYIIHQNMKKANIKLSPTSRLELVKGGHQGHMDVPGVIGELIRSFLQPIKSKL